MKNKFKIKIDTINGYDVFKTPQNLPRVDFLDCIDTGLELMLPSIPSKGDIINIYSQVDLYLHGVDESEELIGKRLNCEVVRVTFNTNVNYDCWGVYVDVNVIE